MLCFSDCLDVKLNRTSSFFRRRIWKPISRCWRFQGFCWSCCRKISYCSKISEKDIKKKFFALFPMVQSASCYDAQEPSYIGFLCCIPKESYCRLCQLMCFQALSQNEYLRRRGVIKVLLVSLAFEHRVAGINSCKSYQLTIENS